MGQYYKPVNVETKEWLYSHHYDNGLKLMEHSWIGNKFVGAVMALMVEGGPWHKAPIVWAGDYFGIDEGEVNYYDQCVDSKELTPVESLSEEVQARAILVNHTKKLYVRFDEIPVCDAEWCKGADMRVNPLPLLTACGNNRGGGDYYENNPDFDKVGIWAGDSLSIEFSVPKSKWYKKLIVGFKE